MLLLSAVFAAVADAALEMVMFGRYAMPDKFVLVFHYHGGIVVSLIS